MSSKTQDPKLTLQNLSEQLSKWKQPYMEQVKQTAKIFQKKVRDHRKETMEKQLLAQEAEKQIQKLQQNVNKKQKESKGSAAAIGQKMQNEQKTVSLPLQPRLQEWRSNTEYGFKDYDELIKNYGEVFKKKQKVKRNKRDDTIEDFRADEREMVEQIYEQLRNPNDKAVPFDKIEQFFQNYELFYYFYNIHPHRLLNLLKQSARKYENKLTKQEFFDFFLIDRPTVSEFKIATQKHVNNVCILPQQTWKKLKNIFDTLDTFGNQKICGKTFFQKIRSNPSSLSLFSTEAIEFPEINRVYTLEKVIFDLENKMQFDGKVDWDTLQDLIYHFNHLQEPTLDIIYASNIQKAKIQKDSNYFLLEPKVLDIIKQIFNRCPKYCESFVKTSFFSSELLQTGLLKAYINLPTRLQNSTKNTYLTLEQVLRRFYKEAPAYIDMDEMLELISIKGLQNSKKLISLYDQIETQSSDEEIAQKRKQRRLKKIRSLEELKKTKRRQKKKKQVYEGTRIKQFNLFKRQQPTIRDQKVQEMIRQKQQIEDEEINKKFKANPIPVSINPQRYQRYARCLQKKKESILNRLGMKRQKDQIVIDYLKSNTKLFEQKKAKPHCEKAKQTYTYQASPLPLHISQELLPKIEAEKAQRRQRLWQESNRMYIEGYWKNIKEYSPPQTDKDDSLLQKIHLLEQKQKFQQIKAKQVPNFEQLQRKFEEELASRKKQFKPTKIQEFKLSSPTNRKKAQLYTSPRFYQFKSTSPPKDNRHVEIKSTKKFNDWIAFNQARMAEKDLKQLQKEKQQEERLIKQRNFAQFMRKNLANCTDNTQILRQKSQQKLRNFKHHLAALQNQTEEQLAQIYARVLQRPFLFEQAGATRKPKSKQRPKKIKAYHSNEQEHPEHPQHHPYKQGLFEKQGEEFHPIQSENLNQSF